MHLVMESCLFTPYDLPGLSLMSSHTLLPSTCPLVEQESTIALLSSEIVASLQSDDMAVDDLIEAAMEVLIGDMTEGCIDEAVWITGDEACEKAAIEAAIRIAEAAEAERIRQACFLPVSQ